MGISFIFPCLNEAETLGRCIAEVQQCMALRPDVACEIIVADNGSTDDSAKIAQAAGAKVVPVEQRGYGAALKGGFAAASQDYVAFADADGSYPLDKLPELYDEALRSGADMVISSRLNGGPIEPGAMPTLHRYLGTPVLTRLINLFFHGKLTDCNSGFRLMKRTSYESWHTEADGMEFASELLISALKHKAKIVEIKGGLRKDLRSRSPHLKTWRDGMRHLLFILSEKPSFFELTGAFGILLALLLSIAAVIVGPVDLGFASIFDIHSKLLLIGAAVFFMQFYLVACYLYTLAGEDDPPVLNLTSKFLSWSEATVFFALLILLVLEFAGVLSLVLIWAGHHFRNLNESGFVFILVQGLTLGGSFAIGLLTNALLKQYIRRIRAVAKK